ncbi:MAG: GNAT family N-acetyltransferase [Alcanivoracaceae bacterium]
MPLLSAAERDRIKSLLCDFADKSPPFSGAPWLLPWMALYGRSEDESRVVRLDVGSGAMLAPMMIRPVKRKRLCWRELRFLGSGDDSQDEVATEYPDVSLDGVTVPQAVDALTAWLRADRGWDLLAAEAVEPHSVLAQALTRAGAFRRVNGRRYRVPLPGQFEGWLDTLSATARARFRRTLRQVGERGLRLEPRLEADALEQVASLHQQHWHKRGQPGAFASQRFREFHRALLANGGLEARLSGLFHGALPLALWYGFDIKGTRYYYQSGIDAQAAEGLPAGEALHLLMIRDAISSGLAGYDFMRGDEQSWKARYGAMPADLEDWILPGNSLRGCLLGIWLERSSVWKRRSTG